MIGFPKFVFTPPSGRLWALFVFVFLMLRVSQEGKSGGRVAPGVAKRAPARHALPAEPMCPGGREGAHRAEPAVGVGAAAVGAGEGAGVQRAARSMAAQCGGPGCCCSTPSSMLCGCSVEAARPRMLPLLPYWTRWWRWSWCRGVGRERVWPSTARSDRDTRQQLQRQHRSRTCYSCVCGGVLVACDVAHHMAWTFVCLLMCNAQAVLLIGCAP